jgi:hypothetical protein
VYLESLRAAFEIVSLQPSNQRIQFQEWLEGTFIAQQSYTFFRGTIFVENSKEENICYPNVNV